MIRYKIAPKITASVARKIVFLPKIVSPMMIEAKPTTIIPVPMLTSAKPWYWANNDPEKATKALEIATPKMIMLSVLAEKLRIICGLFPVARTARPISVFKK